MRAVSLELFKAFVFVQALALILGAMFIVQEVAITENPQSLENALGFFLYVVVSAAVLLLVLKYYKGKRLFFVLELLLIIISFSVLVSSILAFFVQDEIILDAVGFGFGFLVAYIRMKKEEWKSALLLVVSGVVGALLGNSLALQGDPLIINGWDLSLGPVIVFAVILAAYDFIAVFFTKHMVTLAKELGKREAAFSVRIQGDKEELELGAGDLVVPSMLAVAALKLSLLNALFALVGAFAGLFWLIIALEKKKGYFPALPPIVVGALIGLIASHFLAVPFF